MPLIARVDRAVALRRAAFPAIVIAGILAITWFLYKPALGGPFLLDDLPNLQGLASVTDLDSALNFVLSGTGGPLGRPLALATFLPQAPMWGSDATPFLRINILIHLANGLLLFAFVLQLQQHLRRPPRNRLFAAVTVMAVWLLMPLLASSSLMIVQRMTLLSASFVLAGLNGYLLARNWTATRPGAATFGMTAILGLATVFAALSKENGILLPALILAMECSLLQRPANIKPARWIAWNSIVLGAPTVVIVLFLVAQVPYAEADQLRRGFTALERLLSQSRILWEYLAHAFVPMPGSFGPFHDAHPVARNFLEPATLAALVSWPVLICGAIFWRRRFPLAAFAVLWYVAGHLLESTTLPLELYFEHRNYIPVIGPTVALCLAIAADDWPYRRYAAGAAGVYVTLSGFVLLGITSTWGQPQLAARYWFQQNPDSVRAATTLASTQLFNEGPQAALATLHDFAEQHPAHAYIQIPELNLTCRLYPEADHSSYVAALLDRLPAVHFSYTAGSMLDELLSVAASGTCPDLTVSDVAALAQVLAENPRYSANSNYMQFHYKLLARVSRLSGDTVSTLAHLARALEIKPDNDLDMMIVTTLVAANRFSEARSYLDEARERLPWRPLRRYNSMIRLSELRDYVDAAEDESGADDPSGIDEVKEVDRSGNS